MTKILAKNLSGQVFGKLIAKTLVSEKGRKVWVCLCECGKTRNARHNNLLDGAIVSCGCLGGKSIPPRKKKQGFTGTPEYSSWCSMRARCDNKNNPSYPQYGGRGISYCPSWNSIKQFVKDVGKRPSKNHSLDRYPNNNGNYEPGNVRWATPKEQARNTRRNAILTDGINSYPISQWAEITGIHWGTIWSRINKQKWSVYDALFKEVKTNKRNHFAK
jgi:hypothetical protein